MERHDLLLSSGFLAFSRHLGVLSALEESGPEVGAVCGSSSGALVAALWAAGLSPEAIAAELHDRPLWRLLRPHAALWRGLFSPRAMVRRLARLLPARFDGLERPLAVGVCDRRGRHRLLTDGPLAESVAASCAIPRLLRPVRIDGVEYGDGGVVERLPWRDWRAWRGERRAIAHLVEGRFGPDPGELPPELVVVRTPRASASFFGFGRFAEERDEARRLALAALAG